MGFLDRFKVNNNIQPNTIEYVLNDYKKYKNDTFIMFTSKTCDYCSKYGCKRNGKHHGKVYSISGKSKKYPAMSTIPKDLLNIRCPKCNSAISFNTYYPELDKPLSKSELNKLDQQRKKK